MREVNYGMEEKYYYTGKKRDTELLLRLISNFGGQASYDYFGAWYYDSDIGRWLSVDPLSDKYPGWSPYNYVGNNPLIRIDLFGMDWYVNDSTGALHWYDGKYKDQDIPDGYSWLGEDNYFGSDDMFQELRELGVSTFDLTVEQSVAFANNFGYIMANSLLVEQIDVVMNPLDLGGNINLKYSEYKLLNRDVTYAREENLYQILNRYKSITGFDSMKDNYGWLSEGDIIKWYYKIIVKNQESFSNPTNYRVVPDDGIGVVKLLHFIRENIMK
ncbi:MAG: hypothetical protein K9H48_12315 [Melioribacteraceae bacterium]|nr:hypothetical protein [Melioribacteraceae bacterium]